MVDVYNNLKDLTREIDTLEDSRTYLEDRIKMFMGDAETLVSPSGSTMAVWKSAKPSMKFNAKAFREDDPARYAKYMESSPGSRRFSVK